MERGERVSVKRDISSSPFKQIRSLLAGAVVAVWTARKAETPEWPHSLSTRVPMRMQFLGAKLGAKLKGLLTWKLRGARWY